MFIDYLHNHKQFADLLRIIEGETGIQAGLVEKDYWIMLSLHGLQKQGYEFELKGGLSFQRFLRSLRGSLRTSIYISNHLLNLKSTKTLTIQNQISSQ